MSRNVKLLLGVALAVALTASFTSYAAASSLQWGACIKHTAGKYTSGECSSEGSPKAWEWSALKEGASMPVLFETNLLRMRTELSGVQFEINCTTDTETGSLENPIGETNGIGQLKIGFKNCSVSKPSNCKGTIGAVSTDSAELLTESGNDEVRLKPINGGVFLSLKLESCGVYSGAHEVYGELHALVNNTKSLLEFNEGASSGLSLGGYPVEVEGYGKLKTEAGGAVRAQASTPPPPSSSHWYACAKQSGGQYQNSKCSAYGAPEEWEELILKTGESTTVSTVNSGKLTVQGEVIAVKVTIECEGEQGTTSLENPLGGGVGVGRTEIKFKSCTAKSGTRTCKASAAEFRPDKMTVVKEGSSVEIDPEAEHLVAKFTLSECGLANGSHNLEGKMGAAYNNHSSQLEFFSSGGLSELTLGGNPATLAGTIGLRTTSSGYISIQ